LINLPTIPYLKKRTRNLKRSLTTFFIILLLSHVSRLPLSSNAVRRCFVRMMESGGGVANFTSCYLKSQSRIRHIVEVKSQTTKARRIFTNFCGISVRYRILKNIYYYYYFNLSLSRSLYSKVIIMRHNCRIIQAKLLLGVLDAFYIEFGENLFCPVQKNLHYFYNINSTSPYPTLLFLKIR
jgi:hypothetical protein